MSARVRLGAWIFPSGNRAPAAPAFLEPDIGDGVRPATCEWDSAPPLSASDERHYLTVVLPALVKRTQEYLEQPCRRALGLFV